MSELVMWANGDNTFSYIPESQVPAMMQQSSTQNTQPTSITQSMQGLELADLLFLGALVIITVAMWKEPIGYFTLGLLVAWVLMGVME